MNRTLPVISLVILIFSAAALSDTESEINLKIIMQNLQQDMAMIVEGLLVDDFDAVDAAADRIARHPSIPAEQVVLVATELGTEMPAFKQLDALVHDQALAISAAAQEADSTTVARHYQSMLDGCLTCHASYRQRVAEVLNSN